MVKIQAGSKAPQYPLNIEEKDYKVLDGIEFFQRYLFPTRDQISDHFELKSVGLVGSPGSGKTTTMRFLVDFIRGTWDIKNVNAMLTDNVQLAMENIDTKFVQVIVVDDAISHQDSRRSMGDQNVTATQQFMLIRHIAEAVCTSGIIYAIFAFQDPKGIDVRFRNICDVILYKSYFINAGLENVIKDKECIAFLKKITREQKFNNFEYRNYSVGYTSWGDIINIKTPFISAKDFQIDLVDTEGKKEQIKLSLIDKLIEMDLLEETKDVVYGYLSDLKTKMRELELYNFGQTDFQDILRRAKAKVILEGGQPSKNERYFYKLVKFVKDNDQLSFQDIEDETQIPHAYLHRVMQKFNNQIISNEDILKAEFEKIRVESEDNIKNGIGVKNGTIMRALLLKNYGLLLNNDDLVEYVDIPTLNEDAGKIEIKKGMEIAAFQRSNQRINEIRQAQKTK